MYTETLSPTFTGMTFAQASELCFVKLKLLLLALEVSWSSRVSFSDQHLCPGEAGWRGRRQDLHQPPGRQDPGQHRGLLHRPVSRGGQEVDRENKDSRLGQGPGLAQSSKQGQNLSHLCWPTNIPLPVWVIIGAGEHNALCTMAPDMTNKNKNTKAFIRTRLSFVSLGRGITARLVTRTWRTRLR